MANTGYKNWLTLKKYINGVATEETKANSVSDPDYIAPVLDLTTCPTPSNTCPQIDSAISDINVIVGASNTTIDLTTVFSDSDGDTLSYIATSSNSAGVSATISGTNLIISYLSATSASSNISVTASDGTCSAVDSFTATISATTTTTTTSTTTTTTTQNVTNWRMNLCSDNSPSNQVLQDVGSLLDVGTVVKVGGICYTILQEANAGVSATAFSYTEYGDCAECLG